jgi:hypothetical protein
MYEEMYRTLMAAVADAMDLLEEREYQQALTVLEEASRETEETYIGQ